MDIGCAQLGLFAFDVFYMKIIVESHIPFIRGIFEDAGHIVQYLAPEQFSNKTVKDADALVIRTRTKCDATLLDGTRVKKIATATIGTDHIDHEYCRRNGIEVFSAPGCNAPGVAQYVLSSIYHAFPHDVRPIIGIVGVGNVGSIVNRWARSNGYPTLLCDPPKGLDTTLAEIAERADIITFHTPLDSSTFHMANNHFFASLKRKPLIINAARGPVVDTAALLSAMDDEKICGAVIDCWEGEPNINRELLNQAVIATPHIAGYSLEGKRRATAMAVKAIDPNIILPLDGIADKPDITEVATSYNPLIDTANLKANPQMFERLRNEYSLRHEPR